MCGAGGLVGSWYNNLLKSCSEMELYNNKIHLLTIEPQ